MKWIKIPFVILWRLWFYILVIVPIIIMMPALLVTTAREKYYKYVYAIARLWAKIVLFGMGFIPKVTHKTQLEKGKSYMLTANHTSMIDIMMMFYLSKYPFVFVGKKELARFPVFGFFYKRSCILVDRKNAKSRHQAFKEAERRLSQGTSICIFPEGGVPDDVSIKLDRFKKGAFRLALEHQIPIVPISFLDNKTKFRYQFLTGRPGKLRAVVHPLVETEGMPLDTASKKTLEDKTRAAIESSLIW
ncbi:lysophospholipid acyltransferase family protein [Psychroflexus halocasei]|uniref:1-acyl-sn-glycerol-3-phosphate acyltransferase n=1 Tax=Psychroflexus halocasei TaxID=908615 RepID=A0A1H4BIJ2_9FLAO|nr:lysophospholipid acyltransferase family protein [Psychroflexus halocasei]SEA47838.1 1-acyl-sn-glycerol-3-phosphate acyltransferase [Psychroflexus halocasei]